MKVEQLLLKNFRNVKNAVFSPDAGVNFLVGPNGQGKTSFIEALSFLSTLRSFRESKIPNVIQWGHLSSDISCVLSSKDSQSGEWRTDLQVNFQMVDELKQKAKKTAYVNGKPFQSSTQYLSQRFGAFELGFHTIIFNPSDHDLVRGDPATRRSYLDRVIAAEDVDYLKALQRFQRVLNQRNAVFRAYRTNSTSKPPREVLLGFTEQLCQFSVELTSKRLHWISRLAQGLNRHLQLIAPGQPELRLTYLSNWVPQVESLSLNNGGLNSIHFTGQGLLPSLELLEQSFWAKLSILEEAEWKVGHSLVGPHRDDWAFFLGDRVLKGHGSQGEVRSALLALKLSELELFRNETGHSPLFLLDDFSSELDRERRMFLLRLLAETDLQTFVTTTEESVFLGTRYWVSNGAIEVSNKKGLDDNRAKTS